MQGPGFALARSCSRRTIDESREQDLGLIEFCQRFEAIELWVDPDPNSQLQLIWLLDYLRPHADVASKLNLVQTDAMHRRSICQRNWPNGGTVLFQSRNDHLEMASLGLAGVARADAGAWFDLLRGI